MKLIDLSQAGQAAETHPDPIIKMALMSFLKGLPVVEMPDVKTMAAALARCTDICDLCANRKSLPLDECEEADCNCDICKSVCACAGCGDGSNFVWRSPHEEA